MKVSQSDLCIHRVICIRTSRYNKYDNLPLTIGKVYDVISITHIPTGPFFKLVNDSGEISGYSDDCVRTLTLDELRDLKIEELGI